MRLFPRYSRADVEEVIHELCFQSGLLGGLNCRREDILAMRLDEVERALAWLNSKTRQEAKRIEGILKAFGGK